MFHQDGTVLYPVAAIAIKKLPQLPQHGQMGVAAYDAVATPALCLFCEGFLELFYYPCSGAKEVFNRTGLDPQPKKTKTPLAPLVERC
jgi:hypothetical protein